MKNDEKKEYTPEEAARILLERCHSLYKNSTLAKSNTAHEIETGGEPNNDDAEAPEQLQAGEVCKPEAGEGKKKKKGSEEGSEDGETEEIDVPSEEVDGDYGSDDMEEGQPEHEKDMSEEEEFVHDAQENREDEADDDDVEADEEEESKEKDKKMEKSENSYVSGKNKLKSFIVKINEKRNI